MISRIGLGLTLLALSASCIEGQALPTSLEEIAGTYYVKPVNKGCLSAGITGAGVVYFGGTRSTRFRIIAEENRLYLYDQTDHDLMPMDMGVSATLTGEISFKDGNIMSLYFYSTLFKCAESK